MCENHFLTTHQRAPDGRFVVRIPLKYPPTKLGDSRVTATKRLLNLEQRFKSNSSLKYRYRDFLNEYKELGHMVLSDNHGTENEFLLPHHGVVKEASLTTKLRVVFNGSSPSTTGWSVNDLQYTGPSIQNDIVDILTKFRIHHVVVTADVTKMYRQILVHKEDCALQRILCRNSPHDPIQTYDLCTVTYGLKSAPFLAIRCLKQLAIEHKNNFPKASEIISNDFYVDDLITGFATVNDALTICSEINEILNSGGFPLRKWTSNSHEFLAALKGTEDPSSVLFLKNDEQTSTLGVKWNPTSDTLSYCIAEISCETEKITKRAILSDIAKLYDPVGLVSPCIITAKIILQELWAKQFGWDERPPIDVISKWSHYRNSLHKLQELKVPRHALCVNHVSLEYHGFCDASQSAYGACIFLRTLDMKNNVTVQLLIAKARVAPLKTITIPKLELCGAVLLARLMHKVQSNIQLPGKVFLWSDSQIVLCWLNLDSNSLQPFVSHRVAEIQAKSVVKGWTWNHVGTKENPADLCSRGVPPDMLVDSKLWWNGPQWLSASTYEICKINPSSNVPELKKPKKHVFLAFNSGVPLFEKFSNLNRLTRVTAYMLRFINNCKNPTSKIKDSTLSVRELIQSLQCLVKLAQAESFSTEITLIKSKGRLVKHNLIPLSPFIDSDGILRVGGRLKHANLRFEAKHPALLSGKHALTKLIFDQEHKRLLHAGAQLLLATVRQNYWPTSGLSVAKQTIRKCLTCFRFKPRSSVPLMAQLPANRVNQTYPFNITGVDYAGPFFVKDRYGRNYKLIKCYISLFICFTTKCMHLELVSDLTSQAFLSALKRFICRRGKPSIVYSDNGTNFVGIQKHLKFLKTFFEECSDEILTFCANDDIDWKFIPPSSPHFGGLWESGVKTVKHHLHRVIGESKLTYEEFTSVLVHAEAIVNSRPLYPLSTDPNDLSPVTPSHFLIGRALTTLPEPDVTSLPVGRLTRYQLIQQLQQSFWKSWSLQYLNSLQPRRKWQTATSNLTIGAMVLVKHDNLPPCQWLLGRIIEVHPGHDGNVRVATVKTSRGIFKRPVVKLYKLPTSTEEENALPSQELSPPQPSRNLTHQSTIINLINSEVK